jgi:hypothetical protein
VFVGQGASYNTIGVWNLISGNSGDGVEVYGVGSEYNTIIGNYIGTDDSGTGDLGNTSSGVKIYGSTQNNMVGGLEPGDANVIAGNDYHGVWLYGANTNQNTVLGNLIGVGANGTAMLGNLVDGVRIESDASQNTIGPGNVIAANQSDGVRVHEAASIDNLITQNSIYSNTIGISLTDGANGGIGAPVISSLTAVASGYQVSGTACSSCTVELFRNSDADGEGETYLTSGVAEPGGAFNIVVSPHLLMDGAYLTATSTAAGDGTSEFSSAFGYDLTFVMLPIVMR